MREYSSPKLQKEYSKNDYVLSFFVIQDYNALKQRNALKLSGIYDRY